MKRSEFLNQRMATSDKLLRNLWASLSFGVCPFFKGLSHLNHNFQLSSLSDNIRKNEFAHMQQFISGDLPPPNGKATVFRELLASVWNTFSSEIVNKPINHVFVGIRDTKICGELRSSDRGYSITSYGNTPFTIDDSSQISEDSWFVRLSNVLFSSESGHENPFKQGFYRLIRKKSIKSQPQRLTPKTCLGMN
jgi:hypothetical protein